MIQSARRLNEIIITTLLGDIKHVLLRSCKVGRVQPYSTKKKRIIPNTLPVHTKKHRVKRTCWANGIQLIGQSSSPQHPKPPLVLPDCSGPLSSAHAPRAVRVMHRASLGHDPAEVWDTRDVIRC